MSALHKLSYGLFVISTEESGRLNGQIANVAFQVTSKPARVAVCLNKKNLTNEMINKSDKFCISILSQNTPMTFIGLFGFKSGRDVQKFKQAEYSLTKNGNPIPKENVLAYIDVEVEQKMDIPDYTMFIGKVVEMEVLNDDTPMTYDYYHKIKKGKAPKTAPVAE